MTRKSEAVAEREARGELEPETALRRKRLQEVHSHSMHTTSQFVVMPRE